MKGDSRVNIEKEKIYSRMRKISEQRRQLSKQYFKLKEELAQKDNVQPNPLTEELEKGLEIKKLNDNKSFERDKIYQEDMRFRSCKTSHYVSFDRISKNIIYILKQSPTPISNKEILSRIINEFEMTLSYNNLSSNILPRLHQDSSIPVERVCRGFWQYKK